MDEIFLCDEEDYDLHFTEESNSDPDTDLENQYYNSKALRNNPQLALNSFKKVIELEGSQKGEWGFKALKQVIKLLFKMNMFQDMLSYYNQFLAYIKCAVARNYSEKSIISILDYISSSKNIVLIQQFYETTLEALRQTQNEGLWFKINMKLAKLFLETEDFTKLAKVIRQLRGSCQIEAEKDDWKKGTQLLEILALEIQMHTIQKNHTMLKSLYEQSLRVKSAIPHPWIMGVIRECGGKMHLRDNDYENAHIDFFEAFKNYDESGSPRRKICLKYLILASMLMRSAINPFHIQEIKPYRNDPEIVSMTNLISSYLKGDLKEFEEILRNNQESLLADTFVREHLGVLIRNCRNQALLKIIQPYRTVKIPFISKQLDINEDDVEDLLVACILDKTIQGKIDQVNKTLVLNKNSDRPNLYTSIDKWVNQLEAIQTCIEGKFQYLH